jgi:uncharacterized membrane protein YidH (DUF202 family)
MPARPDGFGPGAQPERTTLAWNRTTLALAGNGALVIHVGLEHGDELLAGAGFALLAFGVALWLQSVAQYSVGPIFRPGRPIACGRIAPRSFAILVVAVSVIDFVALLTA